MSRMDLERDVRTEREKTVRAMMHTPSEALCVVEDDTEHRGDRSIGDNTDHEERDHRRILCPALAAPSYSQHQCPQMEPARRAMNCVHKVEGGTGTTYRL